MSNGHGEFRFYHCLSVSLLLHAGIILPFVLISFHRPAPHKCSMLQIELFGVISDRQIEEKRRRQTTPRRPQTRQASKPLQPPDTYKTSSTENPVRAEKTEDKPKPAEHNIQPTTASPASLPAVAGTAGTERIQQRQQTINSGTEQEADKIRKYAVRLVKQVRSNLAYPQEMRKSGIEAVSRIAFIVTKSGDIKKDSLKVIKSSGYSAMDSSALKSALASEPFEKPPKEDFKVSFDVSFTVNMAQAR